MKSFIVLVSLIGMSMAQRPTYAGLTPKLGPELHSRFRTQNDTGDSNVLQNRLGDGGQNANLPVDARGDESLVNRLNQWPREHRPFWLLNAEAIEAQRRPGQAQQGAINQNQNPNQNQGFAFNQQPVQAQTQSQAGLGLANRNNFDNAGGDGFFEVVNGIPGTFDKTIDGKPNVNFQNRFGDVPETRPIRPENPRSSFLRPIN
ncbi:uncharacterized protein LOC109596341 [Aethina tumida]|uniref:uncharacterized protein LOC109596341 n=1 Tax=Aethina tumida TaxID=116153 RepID=UPI0021494618|nr:uncharacterized protein LOC109596341 [Aethina tumida]